MLKQILQGMVVGIANIIPGVSGGTMMVAMGLYDHLIHAITHLKSCLLYTSFRVYSSESPA